MPFKRALVQCAVLALQDSSVIYPCCKDCFSRIDSTSDTRLTCSKCGYSCLKSLLEHRYRLSLRVARGSCMFGITVFGNCLNTFFGIHASGLQRLVADKSGALESSKSSLLVKAVKECFIGKHFIFGVKVTENDFEPWVENSKGNSHKAQLVATQMILPVAPGFRGCTVLNYYEALLQETAETQQCILHPYETEKSKVGPLWPTSHNSATPELTNDTFNSSGFLPLSLSRSPLLDSSLSPTPPWQQTLRLITSSAEQNESSKYDNKSPCYRKKCSTPFEAWLGLKVPTQKRDGLLDLQVKNLSNSGITKSILASCPAKDAFPLSESPTEFLKDKNKLDHSQQNEIFLESVHDIVFMDKSQVCDGSVQSKTGTTKEPTQTSGDEQSEGSFYNCSADLFSTSPRTDITAFAPFTAFKGHASVHLLHTQSVVDSSSLTSNQHLNESENDQKQSICSIRENFQICADYDFIPLSQSTPAHRVGVQKGNSLRSDFHIRHSGESSKENFNSANQNTVLCCETPKSRNRKPDQVKCGLLKKKHFSTGRGVLNSTIHKRRSRGFVPPTPAHLCKTTLFKYNKEQTFKVLSKNKSFQTKSESEYTSSKCSQAIDESECNNANEECDWSRDLFSDSV